VELPEPLLVMVVAALVVVVVVLPKLVKVQLQEAQLDNLVMVEMEFLQASPEQR
jgi:hypothetical protein